MRREAADRYKVLNHLIAKAAFSSASALPLSEIRRATGLGIHEVEWIVGTTAMADMAIVEVVHHDDSPLCRKRVVGYYVATDAETIYSAAHGLRLEARHLIGRAKELEAVACGAARAIPPWIARDFAEGGPVAAARVPLSD